MAKRARERGKVGIILAERTLSDDRRLYSGYNPLPFDKSVLKGACFSGNYD
jgi:hypothetical protein